MKKVITIQHCQSVHHLNGMVGGGTVSSFAAGWLKLPLSVLETTSLAGSAGGVSFFSERDDRARTLNVWNDTSYMNKQS